MVKIYCLSDPRLSGVVSVRYVGMTKGNLSQRLRQHVKDSRYLRKSHKVNQWICQLLQENLQPKISLLARTTETTWRVAEKFWISHWLLRGANLCNLQDGGLGPYGHVDETRAKLSRAHKGRIRSLESRLRQSVAQRGRVVTSATRAKIASSLRGQPFTPERAQRISAAKKGKKHGPLPAEVRTKLSIANRGKVRSPEQIAALTKALRGRKMPPRSDQHRAKMRALYLGRPIPPEQRDKIRESVIKYIHGNPEVHAAYRKQGLKACRIRWEQYRRKKEVSGSDYALRAADENQTAHSASET